MPPLDALPVPVRMLTTWSVLAAGVLALTLLSRAWPPLRHTSENAEPWAPSGRPNENGPEDGRRTRAEKKGWVPRTLHTSPGANGVPCSKTAFTKKRQPEHQPKGFHSANEVCRDSYLAVCPTPSDRTDEA